MARDFEYLTTPIPHAQAIAFLRAKPTVTRAVFDALLPELRARAFVVTGVESAGVRQTIRDAIAEVAGSDLGWDKIRAHIIEQLSPWIGDKAERRAELLLRWHGYQAYAAANHRNLMALSDVFPYQRYITVGDHRVRASHRALDNRIFPADHPFWTRHTPPWEPGCRCDKVGVTADDYEQILAADKSRPPADRWALTDAQLDRVRQTGQLDLGDGLPIDLRTPSERGKPGGMEWSAGDLTMPAADLAANYDPDVWAEFEKRAAVEKLDDGRTVMEWMGG